MEPGLHIRELQEGRPDWNGTRMGADRYVQVQCELWWECHGAGPLLRYVQIGRDRFLGE